MAKILIFFVLCFNVISGLYAKDLIIHGVRVPEKLSEWQIIKNKNGEIVALNGSFAYELINPLFSDYAIKFRTLWLPEGSSITYKPDGPLDFPKGSLLSKTFSYPYDNISFPSKRKPVNTQNRFKNFHIETRVLVKTQKTWIGLPYVWDLEQKDAKLSTIGKKIKMNLVLGGEVQSFDYFVPNMNQCRSCHVSYQNYKKIVQPIGPKARNLNRSSSFHSGVNQLEKLADSGYLEGLPARELRPKMKAWNDPDASLEVRARSYLDLNCGHCHQAKGPAASTGLFLSLDVSRRSQLGICKNPVATGNGGANMVYDIEPGHAEKSLLFYRLKSRDPAVMMPELGRALVHQEGVALIRDWINSLQDTCS